ASFTARIAATESPSTTSFHAARCAAAAPGSRPSGTRSRASVSCSDGPRLETEDLLDLVPQHEDQREGEGREDHGRDEEAKPRAGPAPRSRGQGRHSPRSQRRVRASRRPTVSPTRSLRSPSRPLVLPTPRWWSSASWTTTGGT